LVDLDIYLKNNDFIAQAQNVGANSMENWMVGSKPNHPILVELINEIQATLVNFADKYTPESLKKEDFTYLTYPWLTYAYFKKANVEQTCDLIIPSQDDLQNYYYEVWHPFMCEELETINGIQSIYMESPRIDESLVKAAQELFQDPDLSIFKVSEFKSMYDYYHTDQFCTLHQTIGVDGVDEIKGTWHAD